jgi:tyrosyl-tRNA synthetase
MGCKVIFLVGDYTTMIGDPTGKSKVRPEVDQLEVEKNMQTYLTQVSKILSTDPSVFSWIRNSDWYVDVADIMPGADSKTEMTFEREGQKNTYPVEPNSFIGKAIIYENSRMQKTHLNQPSIIHSVTFSRVLGTLRRITHARLIERDMFKDRIESGQELYMHEMMYPVLQGIDSSVLATIYGSCDMEVGGTDQTFNMLMGRDVMKMNNQALQAVLSFKLLEGTDGKEKMSKSLDNYVGITDEPADMYGKILSIPDTSILNYFELCTYTPYERLEEIKQQLNSSEVNPKNLKMELARQIVAEYHGEAASKAAEEDFVTKFQKKEIPTDIPEISGRGPLSDLLVINGIVPSKSEFRRLIEGGAVTNLETGEKIIDAAFEVTETVTLKIGKLTFVKVLAK